MTNMIDFAQAKHIDNPIGSRMTLKAQLTYHLKRRGMTAAELARKTGVSKQVLSLWLNGSKPKNVDQVKSVADALGVTIDNLMFGDGVDLESAKTTELDALMGTGWVSGLFEVRFRRVKK